MSKTLFLILVVTCIFQYANSQESTSHPGKFEVHETLPKAVYLEDLNQLIDSIQLNHPQPYEFITEKDFEKLIDRKKGSITDSTTISEFVWLCNSVMAAVGCGHTSVSIENILELNPTIFFPMAVNYVDDRLFVIDPLSNEESVKQGTEILSINGVDVGLLRNRIRASIPSDGYNSSLQDFFINSYFRAYCAFQLGFPPTYSLAITDSGETKTIVLTSSDQVSSKENHLTDCVNHLCFEVDTLNSLGIITIRSFVYYAENFPQFQSFIDSSFAKLQLLGIENLVIDLRSNGGGDPYCASYLLQHISDKPFRYYKEGSSRWYTELEKMIPVNKNRFMGKPYVLINGGCFSTTAHLASLIKAHDMGIFIGQETGATYSCNANPTTFLLKNTGLFASVATEVYQTDVEKFAKNKGIIPNYRIQPKVADIMNDRDLGMEKVYHLIGAK